MIRKYLGQTSHGLHIPCDMLLSSHYSFHPRCGACGHLLSATALRQVPARDLEAVLRDFCWDTGKENGNY